MPPHAVQERAEGVEGQFHVNSSGIGSVIGRLPLFGITCTVFILIPVISNRWALYNDKIELVHARAVQVIALPEHPLH